MNPVLDDIFTIGLQSAIPEGELTISQWAEQYRHVSIDRVADPALAGRWKNETTPYLVGIMDAVTQPNVNEILFLKSSQVGGSELINNILGYYIHIDPATMQYICENEGKARAWSVESFAPMIRDTPVLAAIFGEAKQRDSSNMIEAKAFRGGHFALGWATSPATLSSRPRRVICTDETDAFESTKEGDPIKLAEARTKTAGAQRKIIHVTTPRDKETSRVLPLWEESDRNRFFVPCPHCNEFQFLIWKQIYWDENDAANASYICEHCGELIENFEKNAMLLAGVWKPTNPDYVGTRRAFWINELYSPFTTWGEMATAFLEAKKHRDTLKVFLNTRLAEFWEDQGEQIEFADLSFHREEYDAAVPHSVLVLTAGVDVQDDRLEIEVVGWGRGFESWSVDYKIIEGSPGLFDVWDSLSDYLLEEFENEFGDVFKIKAVCIDTGGHHTNQVYKFCKANAGRRWLAIKGSNQAAQPIAPKTFNIVGKNKTRLYHIGTDTAKDEIFSFLKKTSDILRRVNDPNFDASHEEFDNSGYCHFPDGRDESYFRQLCAERKITKYTSGVARKVYEKVSASARNEALDCRVYATAARVILNPNFEKIGTRKQNSVAPPDNVPELVGNFASEMLEKTLENEPKNRRVKVKNSFSKKRIRKNFATNY